MLGEEITNLKALLSAPPESLVHPNRARTERRAEAQADREKLAKQIDKATDQIILVEDARTRQALDRKLTGWHDELERLDAELVTEPTDKLWTGQELDAITTWWDDFNERPGARWAAHSGLVPPGPGSRRVCRPDRREKGSRIVASNWVFS